MTYTDRGRTEITRGLRDAKAMVDRKMAHLRSEMGIMEAELSELGKISVAVEMAIEVMGLDHKRPAQETAE